MNFLLDTHLLVWLLTGDARVTPEIHALVSDPAHRSIASVVSIWEVAIKWPLRERGTAGAMPFSGAVFADALAEANVETLEVRVQHVVALESLPALHADPFDRLLVATARVEQMTLLTCDAKLAGYGESVRLL